MIASGLFGVPSTAVGTPSVKLMTSSSGSRGCAGSAV